MPTPQEDYARFQHFLNTRDPGELGSMMLPDIKVRPSGVPEDAVLIDDGEAGGWFHNRQLLQLVQLQQQQAGPPSLIQSPRGVPKSQDAGELPSLGRMAEDAEYLAIGAAKDILVDIPSDAGRAVGLAMGMDESNVNAIVEGTRMTVVDGLLALGSGVATMASKGTTAPVTGPIFKASAGRLLTRMLTSFGMGAGISKAWDAMGVGPQSGQEATGDAFATLGGAGGQALLSKGDQALKAWLLLDKISPPAMRPLNKIIAMNKKWPTVGSAFLGNVGGSIAGYSMSGVDAEAAPIVFGALAPGVFSFASMIKGAKVARDVGITSSLEELAKEDSVSGAALRLTDAKRQEIAKIRAEAENMLEAGVINNLSNQTLDTANEFSVYAYRNNLKKQRDMNRAIDPDMAIKRASRTAEAQLKVHFPNQYLQRDIQDLDAAMKAIKRTPSQPTSAPGKKLTFGSAKEGATVEKQLRAIDISTPDKAEAALDTLNNLMGSISRSSDSRGIRDLANVVSKLELAAKADPTNSYVLKRAAKKLRDTFVLEGVFGSGFSKPNIGGGRERTFKGEEILNYVETHEKALKLLFPKGFTGLKDIARLTAFLQETGQNIGTEERTITQVMSFFKHRIAFMAVMGGASYAVTEDPLTSALMGTAGAAMGGKVYMFAATKMANMAIKNPQQARGLLQSSLNGDIIKQRQYLRAMIRSTNPEVLENEGQSPVEIQEAPVADYFGQYLPTEKRQERLPVPGFFSR